MASINIKYVRSKFPGKTDAEAAAAFAAENGYHVIVRYKSDAGGDYNNFGCCSTDEEVAGYFNSPYTHDVEIVYDGRAKAIRVTPELILMSKCTRCAKATTSQSLILMGGNDFYICPQCAKMFCDGCIVYLPLTGSPGYAKCPYCNVVLKRAIPGTYA
jgi:uncharacterized Zn-finger protein